MTWAHLTTHGTEGDDTYHIDLFEHPHNHTHSVRVDQDGSIIIIRPQGHENAPRALAEAVHYIWECLPNSYPTIPALIMRDWPPVSRSR